MTLRSSQRVQIWIAAIAAMSAVLVALISQWPTPPVQGTAKPNPPPGASATQSCGDAPGQITAHENAVVVNCVSAGGDVHVNAEKPTTEAN